MKATIKKYLLRAVFCIICIFIVGFLYFKSWIDRKSENLSPNVQPAFQAVMKAYIAGKITGDYWENEILHQSKIVSKLPLNSRLDFYRELLLNCDLDSSRALIFIEVVGDDVKLLGENLLILQKSNRYKELSVDQRKNVDDWLIETRNVSNMSDDKIR